MQTIYKKVTDPELISVGIMFEQAFVPSGQVIPEGWTTDKNSLDIPEPEPTEAEKIKEDVTNTQMAVAELYEMYLGGS